MKTGRTIFFVGYVFLCMAGVSLAGEPKFPVRPIEVVCGYDPGGGTDLGARMVAEMAKKDLGQEVVVVNKPGGGRPCGPNVAHQGQTRWL